MEFLTALANELRTQDRRKVSVWKARGKLPAPTVVVQGRSLWSAEDIEPWIAAEKARREG